MSSKTNSEDKCEDCHPSYFCKRGANGGGSAVYGIGIFGAAYYFIPQAVGGMGFVMAIIKSLGWSALIVYQALSLLKL